MKTILGESIIFNLADGTTAFMKVQKETEDFFIGYDEERINYALSKDKIVEYRRMGETEIVKFNEME